MIPLEKVIHGLPVFSRLKGMETVHHIPRLNLPNSFSKCIFPPEYNKNKDIHSPIRLIKIVKPPFVSLFDAAFLFV